MAVPFSTLVTTAIENRSSEVNDALSKSNALLFVLRKNGGIKSFDGGRTITTPIEYSEPGANAQSYSGYDVLNTNRGEHLTMAEFSIAQYATSISASGLEIAQNSGRSQIIDLVESRVKAAEKALTNKISADLYGDGSTANSLTGIQAMLPTSATTGVYGGISRVDNAWWRHTSTSGTALTSANIYDKMTATYLSLGRNDQERPGVIVSCFDHYTKLISYMQALQRFEMVGDTKYTSVGFKALQFMGTPIFLENNAFGASGMPADVSYFLNLDSVKLRPFRKDGYVKFDGAVAAQDADVKFMKWYGNLTCSNLALNGVLKG
jgi:hypothetical protein